MAKSKPKAKDKDIKGERLWTISSSNPAIIEQKEVFLKADRAYLRSKNIKSFIPMDQSTEKSLQKAFTKIIGKEHKDYCFIRSDVLEDDAIKDGVDIFYPKDTGQVFIRALKSVKVEDID